MNHRRGILLLLILLFVPALACNALDSDGPPRNAVIVEVVANTSLEPWLAESVQVFNEARMETEGGDPVYVSLTATDAGQAVINRSQGAAMDLWIPDNEVWTHLLAQEGGDDAFTGDCVSVAESPLVIAMWGPLAESLGYPARDLGWLDIGSLAADPGAWAYYSGGQFGEVLRLGHTHPGLSATGASTLLALVQAAESQTTPVTLASIEQPIVQASVGAFESAVAWFSSSTGDLAQTMRDRGEGFLGAAVMYESDVVQYGSGDPAIIPVYPFEGTFVATHPACVNGGSEGTVQEGARIFRDYLRGEEAQTLAVSYGLRPVLDSVTVGAPLDEGHGVDLAQPALIFGQPTVETIYAVQDLWQSARKDVNLVMLIDVSGSMRGNKLASVRDAAVQFVQQMGDDDTISVLIFNFEPQQLVKHQQVGPNRQQIISAIQGLEADGDTALYDAIADGANLLENTGSPETSNALVLLSDGLDTFSYRYTEREAVAALEGLNATVFTIAYGNDADEGLLESMALNANGNFYRGDEASIDAIYQEMSAAFGGAVGVGR